MASAIRACAFALATTLTAACAGVNDSDPGVAIRSFVAAEDGNFATARGTYRGHRNGLQYYQSNLALPGSSGCAIYTTADGTHAFGTCDYLESTLPAALRTFDDWIENDKKAEPQWRSARLDPPAQGNVATFESADANGHAILLYVAKAQGTGYRVTETFGTTYAFSAH